MDTRGAVAVFVGCAFVAWLPYGASAAEITLPGGSLRPPAGCVGDVTAGIDDITGTLYCRSRELMISVVGGMIVACPKQLDPVASSSTYIPIRIDLKTRDGSGICISQRYFGERMEVSVGLAASGFVFKAEVKDGADLLILLATAASYRASGAKGP